MLGRNQLSILWLTIWTDEQEILYKKMAAGVFGPPITLDTVKAAGLIPSQRNCSDYALKMNTAGGKDVNAAKYVDNLKSNYGWGMAAKCLIYNATGTTLEYVKSRDYLGQIHGSPYPDMIRNGEWGGFLHVQKNYYIGPFGCSGAVVYRSLRPDSKDQYCDWCFSWNILIGGGFWPRSNRVLAQIRKADHFDESYLSAMYPVLDDTKATVNEDKNFGYSNRIMIAQGNTAEVRGTFKMINV